jgi:hypothetical protein
MAKWILNNKDNLHIGGDNNKDNLHIGGDSYL